MGWPMRRTFTASRRCCSACWSAPARTRHPDASARLHALYRASGRHGLLCSATLLDVLDILHAAGVAALPLKGPVLAAALYPDSALRPFSDLDILVRRPQVPAALQALARNGYALDPRLGRVPCRRCSP